MRFLKFLLPLCLVLAGCVATTNPQPPQLGADGKPLPRLYRITASDRGRIPYDVLDAVNSLRAASGAAPVVLDSQLTAAAATHSNDMSNQNRPWHFGSDGSSPIDRIARVGYPGTLIGENISETYETEVQTLGAWMDQDDTRRVLLSRAATDMGFAWHQDTSGKIWWTLIMGDRNTAPNRPDAL
ncbi:CAP domain-containing protein [Oceanicola sp. S124]|uniref:CAP domain-containing protein n=1 Tax=Oceanicola sp. S124 TaxID=1042378 RepID=UPI0002559110|nr:CAP domain-containing protein [Oceanicola sp. S124]